ncbi:MAG: GTPase HflX, partial [Bryobacteraceae bacterium]
GETKLEPARRRIHLRIHSIQRDLEKVRGGRATQRRQRQAVPLATISLVGYTNAGKSTLFNQLTGAGVIADAKMFATLDPTVRHVTLPSRRKVLMSDTVGFIRNLPTTLVKAFRATLEEVTEAQLLLHVVDASSAQAPEHTAHVMATLAEIGADTTPQILVLNKIDSIDGETNPAALARTILSAPEHQPAGACAISARAGIGLKELLAKIDQELTLDPVIHCTFRIPAADGVSLHLIHERGKVLKTRYVRDKCVLEAEVPESVHRRLVHYVAKS